MFLFASFLVLLLQNAYGYLTSVHRVRITLVINVKQVTVTRPVIAVVRVVLPQ